MLTPRERFMALVDNDPLYFADVIVILEGDGLHRAEHGADLYNSGLAPEVFITGGRLDPKAGCIPSSRLKTFLWTRHDVPKDVIHIDMSSMDTREQAVALTKLAKEEGWERVLLVASHYHQYRAYLTCLRAMIDDGREFWIINAPARDIPWHYDEGWGRRLELLNGEFEKIEKYGELGHTANFEFAIEYQRRKEEALSCSK